MKKYYVNNLRGFANEKIYVAVMPNKENEEFLKGNDFVKITKKEMYSDLKWMRREAKSGTANNIKVYKDFVDYIVDELK